MVLFTMVPQWFHFMTVQRQSESSRNCGLKVTSNATIARLSSSSPTPSLPWQWGTHLPPGPPLKHSARLPQSPTPRMQGAHTFPGHGAQHPRSPGRAGARPWGRWNLLWVVFSKSGRGDPDLGKQPAFFHAGNPCCRHTSGTTEKAEQAVWKPSFCSFKWQCSKNYGRITGAGGLGPSYVLLRFF